MNDNDAPEQKNEVEKLMREKQQRLNSLHIEREKLPAYIELLSYGAKKVFRPRYLQGIEQDLDDINRKLNKGLHTEVLDLISERTNQSTAADTYKELQEFKKAISSREFSARLKSQYIEAVDHILVSMTENSTCLSMGSTVVEFMEEVSSLQSAADRRAPKSHERQSMEVVDDLKAIDREIEELHKYLLQEDKKHESRVGRVIGVLDGLYKTVHHRLNSPKADDDFSRTEKTKNQVHVDSMIFKDTRNEILDLSTMYFRLALRQIYINELIKKNQIPSFALLREHQKRQQEYLRKAVQITKKLIEKDTEFHEIEEKYRVLPSTALMVDRLKDRAELLVSIWYIQEMQTFQQQRLSAICNPQKFAQSGQEAEKEASEVRPSKISNAVLVLVPLLAAKSLHESEEGVKVQYVDAESGEINKPNLFAKTMLHDEANGKSFLLASGAPMGQPYKIITLNNPHLLEAINATEFNTLVRGKIIDGVVNLININVNSTTSDKAREGVNNKQGRR